MSVLPDQSIIAAVRQWVETVVIDLNLCPFARKVYLKHGVRFAVSDARTEEDLLLHLHKELKRIQADVSIDTTLLIHPYILNDFMDYNQFLDLADHLLSEMNLTGVFQIASFHPAYQFAGTESDDAENYTNRSPYPVLHIINEDDLEKAISSHPDIAAVPIRNEQLLRDLGTNKMKALLKACFQ